MKVADIKKEKQNAKKTIVWKDLITGEIGKLEDEEAVGQEVGKKFTFDNEDDDKFNPAEPIVSFRKMVSNNKKDLVSEALDNLAEFIQKRTHKSNTE